MDIDAKILDDHITPENHRLTTMRLRYPKAFVEQELGRHRMFSRNSSSGRAVPASVYIDEATGDETRAGPAEWGVNQRGMQANSELELAQVEAAETIWGTAAEAAALYARRLTALGLHKQVANALLTPFTHYNVIVSGTEYMNFFGLRLDRAARPEIRILAEKMWAAYNESKPTLLYPGDWHLPLVDEQDWPIIAQYAKYLTDEQLKWLQNIDVSLDVTLHLAIYVSMARCARISYSSFKTKKRSTPDEDLNMAFEKLVGQQPIHASPAEHQATPDMLTVYWHQYSPTEMSLWEHKEQWANYKGWRQYRAFIPGEACAPLPEEYEVKDGNK